jgi:signal peptidase I
MESLETGNPALDSAESVAPVASAPRARAPKASYADFLESLLVTILLALFGTTFILQAFKIPSQSMEPTLLVGDHLLVNKFIFEGNGSWYEKLLPYRAVRRADIVVFKFPFDDHPHYVKRVIGLPGDRIRIVDQQVYADNFPPSDAGFPKWGLRPEWAQEIMSSVHSGELLVPPDHFFVMGDNRDRSWDSRYWGFVDRQAIMGRPMVIYWSVAATAEDYNDRSLLGTLRGIEDGLIHLSSRTRWNRMLREVH